MARRTLNLGILAHVDAGKTTLTERLLFAAGAIGELGSVDHGTTQTDSLELERRRGITIRSAVASFSVGDVSVNLIDTPGHPDFIAEVERALGVLDGAVLVISAVEGVQPQTRVLQRALRRLRVPTLLFVNKIDRRGADQERVLRTIAARLTPSVVAMGSVSGPGARSARFIPWNADDPAFRERLVDVLAGQNEELLAAYIENDGAVAYARLRAELAAQTKRSLVHPVFLGSAITGAGVDELMGGLVEFLPAAAGDPDDVLSGTAFKIERGPAGEKVAYVRMFSGTVHVRNRVPIGGDTGEKVTAISAFDRGEWVRRAAVRAGEIGKLWGLTGIRVGDALGRPRAATDGQFPRPTLETVVVPHHPSDKAALKVALIQLAEQDPLINLRQDDRRQEISLSLYGEVQKEVVQATLADDFGIEVTFRESTVICIERPAGSGEAVEILNAPSNPFHATVGLRVDPAPPESGPSFRLDVDPRTVPMYLYKNLAAFSDVMAEHVRATLREGLFGWQVTDCAVTMIECNYSSWDGPPATRGPLSTAADFRKITPLVLMRALDRAGTVVCEPMVRARLEVPPVTMGGVLSALARAGAAVGSQSSQPELSVVEATIPASAVPDLQRQLAALTSGEGVIESTFGGYQPVTGRRPTRRRTTANPLNRDEYLRYVRR